MIMKNNALLITDGYKTGHHLMYPEGTDEVYSNYTCRSVYRMHDLAKDIVVFGVQYAFMYIKELYDECFFSLPKDEVCGEAKKYLSDYLGCDYDVSHFEKLHDLGYLPIVVKSLPEGTVTKSGIPLLTIKNTHKDFAWITNFLETLISTLIWKPVHSASLSLAYKKILINYALKTDKDNLYLVDFQAHDFSFRGMQSLESAISSGMGFATSFKGSDTIPILKSISHYYKDYSSVFSVNATEHSVMCDGSKEGEIETFRRLLRTFPKGILSVVSDTWNLWDVIQKYLPILKDEILERDGKLVIRPDSGDPVDIICGLNTSPDEFTYNENTPEYKGVIELLWDIFGGYINDQGYKVLNSHIGSIYGDSITIERADQICQRLSKKGFASTNIVFGIGSYSMGHATRDSQGGAVKSTNIKINGISHEIFKDPITDDGTKKSAKGLLKVYEENGILVLKDQCTESEESEGLLKEIFMNGNLTNMVSFKEIRDRILSYL